MGVPAVSYRATTSEKYDNGFYRLPNKLSHPCFNFEQLQQTIKKVLSGELGVANDDEQQAFIDHYLAARKGPLACERIVDVLEKAATDLLDLPKPPLGRRLHERYRAIKRRRRKRLRDKLREASPTKATEHQQKKNPEVQIDEIRTRVARFMEVLGYDSRPQIEQLHHKLFRISM